MDSSFSFSKKNKQNKKQNKTKKSMENLFDSSFEVFS